MKPKRHVTSRRTKASSPLTLAQHEERIRLLLQLLEHNLDRVLQLKRSR